MCGRADDVILPDAIDEPCFCFFCFLLLFFFPGGSDDNDAASRFLLLLLLVLSVTLFDDVDDVDVLFLAGGLVDVDCDVLS